MSQIVKTKFGRRSFIKRSALATGGFAIGFSWLYSCEQTPKMVLELPDEWFNFNGYLKIGDNGVVTIMSPNPEIGQNVKTSMPMIVAEELDMDWAKVIVEQAPLDTSLYGVPFISKIAGQAEAPRSGMQIAGGSNSIRSSWDALRLAGATAKEMLLQAAADMWGVAKDELITENGYVIHEASGQKEHYGVFAAAASEVAVPEEVELKDPSAYKIIGSSKKNVDGLKIATGQPLFGIDVMKEGMKIAVMIHPPAFGMTLKSFNADNAKQMPGVVDVFQIDAYQGDTQNSAFDIAAFRDLVVIVADTTWQAMQAKKAVQCEWVEADDVKTKISFFGRDSYFDFPKGLESTATQNEKLNAAAKADVQTARRDGNPERAFRNADRIIEKTYSAPYLAHNTMEPMNFFADVTAEKAHLIGPIQTPSIMEPSVAARLGMNPDEVHIEMTRMGGGFGRRLYGHFLVEAAAISQHVSAPIKLLYTREDDMSCGVFRPAYQATYRAAIDKNNVVTAFHVRAGGIPESPLAANRFPAGAYDNYLAESYTVKSNVTTGAFRAPRSNFIAAAEQSFLDELAEAIGKDPVDYRLELFDRAINDPVGDRNDYDANRYAEVIRLAKEKSNWGTPKEGVHRGFAAYFCHNSYVADVVDLKVENGQTIVENVCVAVDCGIVVNKDAAINLVEGGTVDGIGTALYSGLNLKQGAPQQTNFDRYRLIRHAEAPKAIEVHFVNNGMSPTGLGEPMYPPVMGALANAMYQATGKRLYQQPFAQNLDA
ncbi:MAG: xanthine dehydrogenase family protein molybdopterin-binding subunit [Flavobacteriaceae bacterium]|nr:xanthine dehydrogenase family protein molybdopterin-binding subunit [Flavobacteriaceae bacterium]